MFKIINLGLFSILVFLADVGIGLIFYHLVLALNSVHLLLFLQTWVILVFSTLTITNKWILFKSRLNLGVETQVWVVLFLRRRIFERRTWPAFFRSVGANVDAIRIGNLFNWVLWATHVLIFLVKQLFRVTWDS